MAPRKNQNVGENAAAKKQYERDKLNSRLKRIAKMRKELRHLEGALNHIEHLVRAPSTPLAALRSVAVPFRGWTQSVVESYVILEHVISTKADATLAMKTLSGLVSATADLYAPRVIEPDPVDYVDPMDRMDVGSSGRMEPRRDMDPMERP